MGVSKKGCPDVTPPSKDEEIRKTLLNWRSIKIHKKRENVLQTKRVEDLVDFNSKETFEDMKVTCKNQIDLSKKASQRVKTSYAEVETRKILEQGRIREIQKQREIAHLKIDKTKDTTAGFNDNKEMEEGEIACLEINQIKDTAGFNDNKEAKKRERARLKEIRKQREIARLKLDQIGNTARLNDNMEAEREFYKLTRGRLLSEDEFHMLIYFEEPLDPLFYQ